MLLFTFLWAGTIIKTPDIQIDLLLTIFKWFENYSKIKLQKN
jgi:hypothetical protein